MIFRLAVALTTFVFISSCVTTTPGRGGKQWAYECSTILFGTTYQWRFIGEVPTSEVPKDSVICSDWEGHFGTKRQFCNGVMANDRSKAVHCTKDNIGKLAFTREASVK